jgi:hypothetical protein
MSIRNIQLNGSPASTETATQLEAELNNLLPPDEVTSMIESGVQQAFASIHKIIDDDDSSNTDGRFDGARLLLQRLDQKQRYDALPLDLESSAMKSVAVALHTDGLLSDVNEDLLYNCISDLLGVEYLSECVDPLRIFSSANVRITGTVYGPFSRPLIALPCRRDSDKSDARLVIFTVDTGSPRTLLPPLAMTKICGGDGLSTCVKLLVAGVKIQVDLCNQSPLCGHRDVPVLGMNFFLKLGAHLEVDYDALTCSLTSRRHDNAPASSSPSSDCIERLITKLA